MFDIKLLRKVGLFTLFFFIWFCFCADFNFAQKEDDLQKAKLLFQQGDYEGVISLLTDFINKLKAIAAQKKNVAEAFYLLAKVYYTVGEDEKVVDNLHKVFETYANFTKEETDLEFKEQVEKAKIKFLQAQKEEIKKHKPLAVKKDKKKDEKKVIPKPVKKKKKKKKFPILLVVVGVAAVVAAVLLLGKKSESGNGYEFCYIWILILSDTVWKRGETAQFTWRYDGTPDLVAIRLKRGHWGTHILDIPFSQDEKNAQSVSFFVPHYLEPGDDYFIQMDYICNGELITGNGADFTIE